VERWNRDARRARFKDFWTSADRRAQSEPDQVKFLKDTKETDDKAAQAPREVATSQAGVTAQVGDTLKANTANSEALTQQAGTTKKDIVELKNNLDEDRQNVSNISPGFAVFAALAALLIGHFVA
jgi:hypothetical protein